MKVHLMRILIMLENYCKYLYFFLYIWSNFKIFDFD